MISGKLDNAIDIAYLLQREQENGQCTLGMTCEAEPSPPPLLSLKSVKGSEMCRLEHNHMESVLRTYRGTQCPK